VATYKTTPGGGSGGGTVPASGDLLGIAKWLMSNGATRAAAAGIASVIDGESSGDPESEEAGGGGGWGLIQWTGSTDGLPAGVTGPTGNVPVDMLNQLKGTLGYIAGRGGLASINAQSTVDGAADVFSRMEGPAVPLSDTRPTEAATLYSQLAGYVPGSSSSGTSTLVDEFTVTGLETSEYGKGGTGLPAGTYETHVWANGAPDAPPHASVDVTLVGGSTTPPTPTPTGTPTLVEGANYGVAHNSQFIYDEIRPVKLPAWNDGDPLPSGTTWTGDCSSFMTLLSKWAGLPDPNGPSYNYNGDGNGASLFSNLPAITQAEAIPGDVVGFGEIHVAMMMQDGTESDPDVASFGEQGDPRIWSLSAVEADTSSDLWFAKLAPR
jgi:hypothetical protein